MIDYSPKEGTTFGSAMEEMWTLVTLLRSKDGCPWDREQHSKDVATNMIGEIYELVDALNDKDNIGEAEELGDVLLNIVLLIRIALEERGIDPVKLINEEVKKIYSRHPHVFGEAKVDNTDDVLALWRDMKKKEGKAESENDFFSRLPKSMNVYDRAAELHKKVRKIGFDWDKVDGVYDKVYEELKEVENAVNTETEDEVEIECGDLIFSAIALCTRLNVQPEIAIRRTNQKFEKRFNAVVKIARERGVPLDKDHFEELDRIWDEVKVKEKSLK